MSLVESSGEHSRTPVRSGPTLRDAVRRAVRDAQALPLPRALSVDKMIRPLVREIQYEQYQYMPLGFFSVICDLLVLGLSLNSMVFTTGDLAPYPGITERELTMIALFDALKHNEICDVEVMNLARRLIGPSLQVAVDKYSMIHCLSKVRLEDSSITSNGKRQLHSSSASSITSQEVLRSMPPEFYFPDIIDSHPTPLICSSAVASSSDNPAYTNTISASSHTHPLPLRILSIPAKPRATLSPIHQSESSTPLTSTPKPPFIGPSRFSNVPSTPSPNIVNSSKYLGAKRQSYLSSRRSNTANKENIPPQHRC